MNSINRVSQALEIDLPEIPAPSIKEMALTYPNFVGKAEYYDLRDSENQRECCGTFIIVYTKPVRSIDDLQEGELELFPVGMGRKVEVVFTEPNGNAPRATQFDGDDVQSWATAMITCGGQECELELEAAYPRDAGRVHATAGITRIYSEAACRFEQVLQLGLQDSHHSVRFGEREIGRDVIEGGLIYGFRFIELKLKCFRPETGEDDTQLVIAVKIPDDEDVSSVLLLKQIL